MPINVFGQGAVQTAYVSYIAYPDFSEDLTLLWPSTYTTSPNILAASNSFTPSTTGLTVTLPDANQVSLGMNALITNAGEDNFTLLNNSGDTIQTILPSVTYFIQLTAYTDDTGGVWQPIVQGAGTSTADAAALAGLGLVALGSPLKLNTDMPTKTTAIDYTLQPSDRSALYILTGGASSIFCPDDGTTTVLAGFNVSFNNAGTGVVTFTGVTSTALFNGQTELLLYPGQTMTLDYDGVNYWSVGLGQATSFATNILNQDLVSVQTGGNINLSADASSKYIQQYYCSGGPITGNIVIYFPAIANTWYISNFCTSSNGSILSVCLGNSTTPVGTPIIVPNGQRMIFYAASASGTGTLQMYNTPTVITPSSTLFAPGTVLNPSIAFSSDPTSGLYLNATYVPTMASHGADVVQFSGASIAHPLILANPGTTSRSTYGFIGAPNYGMGYTASPTSLDFYAGSSSNVVMTMDGTYISILDTILTYSGNPVAIQGFGGNANTGIGFGGFASVQNSINLFSNTSTTAAQIGQVLDTAGTATKFSLQEASAPTAIGYMSISGTAGTQVLALGTTANQLTMTAGGGVGIPGNLVLNGGFNGTPTTGSLAYFDGTKWVNLGPGTMGQVLTMGASLPAWA